MDDIRRLRDYNSIRRSTISKEDARIESKNAIEWFKLEMKKRNGKVVIN